MWVHGGLSQSGLSRQEASILPETVPSRRLAFINATATTTQPPEVASPKEAGDGLC